MTSKNLREKLFYSHLADLKSVFPDAGDIFICPICLEEFSKVRQNQRCHDCRKPTTNTAFGGVHICEGCLKRRVDRAIQIRQAEKALIATPGPSPEFLWGLVVLILVVYWVIAVRSSLIPIQFIIPTN